MEYGHLRWVLMSMWLDSDKCIDVEKMVLFPTATQVSEYIGVFRQNN